ncbi:eCIS core domain-containing protein [Methyloterricola oryzae]|uniref:eCIS core domain-containing protein n=1 Tax=Methyloterricola oryzae TaxID=1495050 RepID=UPI0009E1A2F7|nr:DUF4157 domain-containing protein [Methyloterricola oryzae]
MSVKAQISDKRHASVQLRPQWQAFQSRPFSSAKSMQPNADSCGEAKHDLASLDALKRPSIRVQPKLKLGPSNDIYEQEADRIAKRVVRENMALSNNPLTQENTHVVKEPLISRYPFQDLQSGANVADIAPNAECSINASRGSGQPLTEKIRTPLERAFGANFEQVRIHTDSRADALGRSLHARAFTSGPDIYFRSGEFNVGNSFGQELLSHELTHVLQQRAGGRADVIRPFFDREGNEFSPNVPEKGKWEKDLIDKKFRWTPNDDVARNYHQDLKNELSQKALAKKAKGEKEIEDVKSVVETNEGKKDPFYVLPNQIRFSQSEITPATTGPGAAPIYQLVVNLATKKVKPEAIEPIRILVRGPANSPVIVSLDNRRLWAFRQANALIGSGSLISIRCVWASEKEIRQESYKFQNGQFGSDKVKVTDRDIRNKENWMRKEYNSFKGKNA